MVWTGARLECLPHAAARKAGLYMDFLQDGPLAQRIKMQLRGQTQEERSDTKKIPPAEHPPGSSSLPPRPRAGLMFWPGKIPGLSRQQPLAKAVGPRAFRVADATTGLGGDSILLTCLGYQVLALERNPVVYELLKDALHRLDLAIQVQKAEIPGSVEGIVSHIQSRTLSGSFRPHASPAEPILATLADAREQDPPAEVFLSNRLRLFAGEGRVVLPQLNPAPDVVYLDPMFPPKRKKSALPNKAVRLLRELVGDDPDAPDLLAVARAVARQRVVVKRPTYAPPLADKPAFSYTGKLVRYDVYRVGDGG